MSYVPMAEEQGLAWSKKTWKLCSCIPRPSAWPKWLIYLLDYIDWGSFLNWFLDSEGNMKDFEADAFIAHSSLFIIFIGPFMPLLTLILPRRHYMLCQFAVDTLEVLLVQGSQTFYGFRAKHQWTFYVNWTVSTLDAIAFKGPSIVDDVCPDPQPAAE